MNNYRYQELIEIVTEVFGDFREVMADVGQSVMQSLERFFNDYGCVIDEGPCEAAIVCSTLCIELNKINEKSISKRHFDRFMSILSQYDTMAIVGEIDDRELQDLNERVKTAIAIINNMEKI